MNSSNSNNSVPKSSKQPFPEFDAGRSIGELCPACDYEFSAVSLYSRRASPYFGPVREFQPEGRVFL
jgi:hypothetical protein